jgi:hypothetical protein
MRYNGGIAVFSRIREESAKMAVSLADDLAYAMAVVPRP